MKAFTIILSICGTILLTACSSVRVGADYDTSIDYSQYKTFAFHKPSIDKVEISDLDKKRILRNIDEVMLTKGFEKTDTPDILISFFTKEQQRIDLYRNNFGFGYGPFYYRGSSNANVVNEGYLYIDLIDSKSKELIWQGQGIGVLEGTTEKKEKKIKEFVTKILSQYPPNSK